MPSATILALPGTAPKESYTRLEVRRLLGLAERQLQSWERHHLIPALVSFSMADLNVLRNLRDLRNDHVPVAAIEVAIAAVRKRMAGIEDPLKNVKLISSGRRVRVEIAGQEIDPVSGQLVLDFDAASLRRLVSFPVNKGAGLRARRETAEAWFQKGLELEQAGAAIEEIISAYEDAIKLDPSSAGAWLNLGTIYFNARMWVQAERHYRKALDSDPNYPLAHFNLANLYDERGESARALEHYISAIRLNPTYADAHYNLALLHQSRGRVLEAVRHWRLYLKLDTSSQWAEIARRELDKLKKSTVVEGRRQIRVVGDTE